MRKCKENELEKIYGGTTISSTLVNAFTNIIKVLMDAGVGFGSSIRRIATDNMCPLK